MLALPATTSSNSFYRAVLQGAVLPLELVLMLIIINRRRVMGSYTNNRTANILAGTTALAVGVLAIIYVAQSLAGAFSGH